MSAPYVPPDTTGSAAVVVLAWVFPVIASIFIALRFYARRLQKIPYGADDWTILVAIVPLWGHTAIILWSVYLGGVGHHIVTLQPSNISELFKSITTIQFSFGLTLGLAKTAIVLLLMRIFTTPGFRKAAWFVIGYIVCWTLMCILIGAAMCRPFALNWDKTIQGECGNELAAYTAIAAFDIIGDLMIIILPMPKIWNLQQSFSTKVVLSAFFALGLFDVAVAILRIIYLVDLMRTDDYTWTAVNCWVWSVLEPSIAVVIACGPTLRPLFLAIIGRKQPTSAYSNTSSARNFRSKGTTKIANTDVGLESLHSNSGDTGDGLFDGARSGSIKNGYNAQTGPVVPRESDITTATEDGIRVQSDINVTYHAL